MRLCLFVLLGSVGAAQSTTATYTTDINGKRVESLARDSSGGVTTERRQTINGRDVPVEQSQQKVLREDANGKVVETITRKYDQNGRLASTQRVLTEEQKLADGGSLVKATTFRSDVNGTMQEAERQTTSTHTAGTTVFAETQVERPTINGSLETMEKRTTVTEPVGASVRESETVYRRSTNGDFQEALREVKTSDTSGGRTVVNTADYEPGVTGQLRLARQSVSTTTKNPDGSEVTELNLYARSVDGNVQENEAPQQIKEQQIIERQKGPGGSTIIETVSVRRPSASEPNRLSAPRKISETICKGDCEPKAAK